MRRSLVFVIAVVAVLGLLAPAAYAQAPAPKVTITGLVDFVATAYKNWSGGGCPAGCDVTDGGQDSGAYSRERGVFTITGEVGKSKGVWAIELDFTNGVIRGTQAAGFPGTSASFDLDTDVAGFTETKWLYLETPITGAGSLMPFIPVETIGRFGAQPARGHDYKVGILFSGDYPGINLATTWSPTLRSTLTFAQLREQSDRVLNAGAADLESWALLASVEVDVFKGLTVKPTYAFAYFEAGSGNANLGLPDVNLPAGTTGNAAFGAPWAGGEAAITKRHTIGGDVRWQSGPFSVQPTAYFQWGTQEIPTCAGVASIQCATGAGGSAALGKKDVDIWTWIFDVIGGFRTGPLNLEARFMWTPGMESQQFVLNGNDVHYYQPINPAFGYMAGWSEIWTGGVDYITASLVGAPGVAMRTSPSYDKYGRIFVGAAVDYNLTPALVLLGTVNASWTSTEVDTNSVLTAGGLAPAAGTSNARYDGDERYLGTEVNGGFTYRFAPNVAFDLRGAVLFAGSALDHQRSAINPAGVEDSVHDADNIYKAQARIRFTF